MRLIPQSTVTCQAYTLVCIVLCLLLSACGTGIEVTEHVTDKDVRRVMDQIDNRQSPVTLDAYLDSLPAWKTGKRFWVADDKVTQMLAEAEGYDKDTLHLAGHILTYLSWSKGGVFVNDDDNRRLYIDFDDKETGLRLHYRYGKAREANRAGFTLPMLIDMDMVDYMARQLVGKEFFIRTPIWYDRQTEQMIDGRHFIKVAIDSVLPGNAVLPLRVLFTTVDTHQQAMVWMSDNASTMHGRDFDALFVASDPHLSYPAISDDNWRLITCGQVVVGMTKEECLLSLGTPKRIAERPDQGGLKEYWYYEGGSYLYFVDGLLNQFRR